MNIVHIDNADSGGGASRSAYRLHEGLRRSGQNSVMYVLNKYTKNRSVKQFRSSPGKSAWISRNSRRLRLALSVRPYRNTVSRDQTFFSDDRTPFYLDACQQIPKSEVINLHWVAEFIDLGAFFEWLPKENILVWTLHDMASFTGGCCHAMGCPKFIDRCGTCPQLGSTSEHDLTREVWQRKKNYYSTINKDKFHIVSPSQWLSGELKSSPLLGRFSTSVIPYGLDLEVFKPRDRQVSREVLGIPMAAKVILFVSNGAVRLKGFHVLVDALDGLDGNSDVFLVSIGFDSGTVLERFKHTHIDSIKEEGVMSLIYSAADVFVLPSLADNLPNTMLESMACGTPVVAFATGGIPEAVRPGVTGLLAKTGDAKELRSAILGLLENEALRSEMAANCRKVALAEYSLKLQADRYTELYESMLTSSEAKRAR